MRRTGGGASVGNARAFAARAALHAGKGVSLEEEPREGASHESGPQSTANGDLGDWPLRMNVSYFSQPRG
jgi:hypothetical protein